MVTEKIKVHVLSQSPETKYSLLRPAFGELCEPDSVQVERLLDILVELLEEKYGCTRQTAESEVERLLADVWVNSR